MPYIPQSERDGLTFFDSTPTTAGQLAYKLTTEVLDWLGGNESYASYALAVGVLETVKLELYRRNLTPYENRKREENGDLPGFDTSS